METAFAVSRPGSVVGYVGVPHGVEPPLRELFVHNSLIQITLSNDVAIPTLGSTLRGES